MSSTLRDGGWQVWAGVLVLLGGLATAGYAVVETLWG